MEVTAKIRFDGREDPRLVGLERKLNKVGQKVSRKLMRRALKAVAEYWVTEVKARVPVLTGALRDSIGARVTLKRRGNGGVGIVEVGPTLDPPEVTETNGKKEKVGTTTSDSPGVYGMFLEFGLKTRNMVAQPFMRPTFDATADKAVTIFAAKLAEGLKDVVIEDGDDD
jgi:HK97 gp10 family phage protein